jgi:uncharacterized protein
MIVGRFLLMAAVVVCAASAEAQTLGIVATQPGSATHSISTAIARVIVEKAEVQARVQVQGASALYSIDAGAGELGLANAYDNIFFLTGTGEYEREGKHPDMRVVATILPIHTALFVRKDSPVHAIKDLKGLRLGSGFDAQKSILRFVTANLVLGGLTYGDVKPVPAANIVNAADDFAAGKSDAFAFALGTAKVKEIDIKVGSLRAISVESAPAAVARMQELLPGAYVAAVQPSPGFDGVLAPTNIVTTDFLLMTNAKVSADTIYKIAKALHGAKRTLVETFGALSAFEPDRMSTPYPPLVYHPGAVKFYQEAGIWPAKG